MTKQLANDELRHAPLITYGLLGQVLGVGPAATKAAALRIGIEARQMGNGRALLSYEQAEAVAVELKSRIH
jgi:hypothetical protein